MQKTYSYLLSISLFWLGFVSTSYAQELSYKQADRPSWVIKHQYDPNGELAYTQSNQYLLFDTQVNIAGELQQYTRYVSKPLTTTGVSDISKVQIDYNPAYQHLILHSVTISRKGEARSALNLEKVRILQQEEAFSDDIYMGLNTAVLLLEDVRVGDIVDYEYSIVGYNPIFGDKHYGYLSINWLSSVDKRVMRLLSPKNEPLLIKAHNTQQKLQKATVGGLNEHSLVLHNTKPVNDEKEYPYTYTPYSWFVYSQFNGWPDVKAWADEMYQTVPQKSAELNQLFSKINSESKNDDEFISNALSFVQNDIRYLGLEFGRNSHLPHSPVEVIQKRFGDCKDKSLLLTSLLEKKGIRAYSALVSTDFRDGILQDLASPGAFNHVITMIEHGGKRHWVDATKTYQAGGLDSLGKSDYGYALIVGGETGQLVRMYDEAPVVSKMDVIENIYVKSYDEPVRYEVETRYYYGSADYQRYRFANEAQDDIKKAFVEFYKSYYSGLALNGDIQTQDKVDDNVFITKESYLIDQFWEREDRNIKGSLYTLAFVDVLKKPQITDNRQGPFYLGYPREINNIIKIHFPEEIDWKANNDSVEMRNETVEYRYTDHYANAVYTYTGNLSLSNKVIDAQKIGAYLDLTDKIKNSWVLDLNFVDPATSQGYRSLIQLKKRLKELSQ